MTAPYSIEDVVKDGLCVGCGGCRVIAPAIRMRVTEAGQFEADLSAADAESVARADKICPFSDASRTEDELASRFSALPHDPRTGFYSTVTAGRMTSDEAVVGSSSGGLTSWIAIRLIETGLVDGVIHVGAAQAPSGGRILSYRVSNCVEDLTDNRKSQYYSTELSEAILSIRGDGKRYALIGVPCFIKAGRDLAETDPVLGEQLKFFLGLTCGHLKSSAFAEALAWQVGIAPDDLARVDFRVKIPGNSANNYAFSAWSHDGATGTDLTRNLLSGNWGHGMFQMKACDFCDDIFAEAADICFGDAWLPEYNGDWRGTNIVVSRNPELDRLLSEGVADGRIGLNVLTADDAARSQDSNYRHRWDGLSVRLADDLRAGKRVPKKRIAPGSRPVSLHRRLIVRLRRAMGERSHQAFLEAKAGGSFQVYRKRMQPMASLMGRLYRIADLCGRIPVFRTVLRKLRII